MQRLGDSTGLLRASLHSPVLEALGAPGRTVLCFHQSAVKWDQLRIKISEVAPGGTELYVVLLSAGKLSAVQQSDILRIYRLTQEEWLALRLVDTHYRLARLSERHDAPESPYREQQQQEECMIVEVVEEVPSMEPPLTPSVLPLWPAQQQQCDAEQSGLVFYAASLCDYVALRKQLPQASPRLQRKWLQWLECHFSQCGYSHPALSYQFAATLARATPLDRPLVYGTLDWALARDWLDLQCHLFAQQPAPTLEFFEQKLQQHVRWIQCWSHRGFYHCWEDYCVPDSRNCWWRQESGAARVTINSLWLLQCVQLASDYRTGAAPGCISLSRRALHEQLLPLLYRLMLSDLLYLLRAEAAQCCTESWTTRQLWDRDSAWYWESARCLQPLSLYKGDWTVLEHYSREWAQNHSSPVMRALLVQERAEEERRQALGSGQAQPSRVCEVVPDIEDLGSRAPPCMQRVLRQRWCKNDDRFNLVGWLYDAGYTQQQVTGFLCRHNDSEEQRETIRSLYRSCVKRPQDKRHKGGRVSTTCGRVIDARYGAGNVLRCPYEEARNGERRREHSAQEKSAYGAECGLACGLSQVRHPLDFVEKKCGVAKITK